MTDFRILQTVTRGALSYTSRTIDASRFDDVGKLAITTTRGMSNPLNLVAGNAGHGIFRPDLYARTTSRIVQGSGGGALEDAVRSLDNLGRRHGVNGIILRENPSLHGSLKLRSAGHYESGGKVLAKLGDGDVEAGRKVAFRIDAAARRVADFAGLPT